MTKHLPTTLALILLLAFNCLAQDGVSTKLDEYMQAEMKAQQIPGVSLAIIKNGQIILAKGYGFANVEHHVPVKLNNGQTRPYGFGWALGAVRGHRYVQHGGAWQGFKAQIFRYLDDKFTVVLFANQTRANQSKLAQGVAALFNPEYAQ